MAEIEIRYSYLDDMAEASNNLAEQLSSYANELAQKVNSRFGSVTDGSSSNLENAKYYINAKIGRLKDKSTVYSNLGKAVSSLRANAEEIDTGIARQISQNYDTFIESHQELKIDDWKAKFLETMSWLRDKIPVLDFILNLRENILDGIADIGKTIKHWYKCEGGKEIAKIVFAIGGMVLAVAIFIASFPASGVFAILSIIGAVIGVANAANNFVTSVLSYAAIQNGDPAWAKIYGDTDNVSDSLRLTNFNNGYLNKLSNQAAFAIDVVDAFCAFAGITEVVWNVGKYLNTCGNIIPYFKTVKWSNGKIVANSDGIAVTTYTLQSVWRGFKSFIHDLPIASDDVRGIRTIFKSNMMEDIRYYVNNPGIFRSIVFPKDMETFKSAIDVQSRVFRQMLKSDLDVDTLKSMKNTLENFEKFITDDSDIFTFVKKSVVSSFETTSFIDDLSDLRDKLGTLKVNLGKIG